jgi:hypothetical protein
MSMFDPEIHVERDLGDVLRESVETAMLRQALARTRQLTVGVYQPTERFRQIREHACVCRADDMGLVAVCGPAGDPESEKDAELFAAAEELLAACKGALNPTGHTDQCMENRSIGVMNCSRVCARIRAAIAKATGAPVPSLLHPALEGLGGEPSDDPPGGWPEQPTITCEGDPFEEDPDPPAARMKGDQNDGGRIEAASA